MSLIPSLIHLQGLPAEWETMLKTSGITKEMVLANPDDTLKVLEFQSKHLKEESKPAAIPPKMTPASTSNTTHSAANDTHAPTPLPEEKPLTLSELVSKDNPVLLYKNMEKIGEG